ncbi:hypothetical protein LI177_02590 [bacterium 210820-DFI.6.37]|nr:hypothetical protein [bacterium 210820-DFI.6.37]
MPSRKQISVALLLFVFIFSFIPMSSYASSSFESTAGPHLKATAVKKTSIKLKWSKIKKASGYQIYRSTSKNGKYKKIKTIKRGKTVSYIDKNRKRNVAYWYKVRAYKKTSGKTKFSLFSASIAGVNGVTAPSFVKATGQIKSTPMLIVWDFPDIKKMSGYQIYKSATKNGKYKKIAVIKKSSVHYFIDKKVSAKKTYYYKVRGYKTNKGKTSYGKFVTFTGKALNGDPVATARLLNIASENTNTLHLSFTNDPSNDTLQLKNTEIYAYGSHDKNDWFKTNLRISSYSNDGVNFKKSAGTYTSVAPGQTIYLEIQSSNAANSSFDASSTTLLNFRCKYNNLSGFYWLNEIFDTTSKKTPEIDFQIEFPSGNGCINLEDYV